MIIQRNLAHAKLRFIPVSTIQSDYAYKMDIAWSALRVFFVIVCYQISRLVGILEVGEEGLRGNIFWEMLLFQVFVLVYLLLTFIVYHDVKSSRGDVKLFRMFPILALGIIYMITVCFYYRLLPPPFLCLILPITWMGNPAADAMLVFKIVLKLSGITPTDWEDLLYLIAELIIWLKVIHLAVYILLPPFIRTLNFASHHLTIFNEWLHSLDHEW